MSHGAAVVAVRGLLAIGLHRTFSPQILHHLAQQAADESSVTLDKGRLLAVVAFTSESGG